MSSTSDLVQQVVALGNDARFASLFASDGRLSMALWFLELEHSESTAQRLLYARIILAPRLADNGTTVAKHGDWDRLGESEDRYRLHRMVVTGPHAYIQDGLLSLLEGRTLSEAFADLGPSATFAEFRLGANAAEVARDFTAGPVRFLPASPPTLLEGLRPLTSPSSSDSVFVASAVRLHKVALFERDSEPLPGADEMARKSLEYLERQTGSAFTGVDCRRLGNIEWLSMPSTDAYENSFVTVTNDVSREGRTSTLWAVNVSVRPGMLPTGAQILVRCRLFVENGVGSDTCLTTVVGSEKPLSFPVPAPVTRILVTIWQVDDSGIGHIWFEHEVPLLREIALHMGLMGLHGNLESDWTRSLKSSRRDTRTRIDKVRSLGQVSYKTSAGGGDRDPWEQAERDIERLPRKLFPPKSGAHFFVRGWHDGAPGLLGFVEWFRELTDDATVGTMLVADPYFDVTAIAELLARARGTHIEYVVLTNSQVASKDDALVPSTGTPPPGSTPRAERLRRACVDLSDILSRFRFKLLDLRSKGKGSEQLFHDRYILLFSRDGSLERAFQLSNSLQLSSKGSPLLVTPIPSDILERVGAYVGGLLEGDPSIVGQAFVATVSSTEILRSGPAPNPQQPDEWLAGAGGFLARVYGRPELGMLSKESLIAALTADGLCTPELSFNRDAVDIERVRTIVAALPSAEWTAFVTDWTLLCQWCAHLASGRELLCEVSEPHWSLLAPLLHRYVVTARDREPPAGFDKVVPLPGATGLVNLFRRSFGDVLSEAEYLLRYHDRSYSLRLWGVRSALQVFRSLEPGRLVQLAAELWTAIPVTDRATDNSIAVRPFSYLIGLILDALVEPPYDESLSKGLLLSELPILRALGAHMALFDVASSGVESAIGRLGCLNPTERLSGFAEWVDDLRVQTNRNGYTETEEVKNKRVRLFEEIARIWPQPIGADQLREVVRRLGGPGEGAWAMSTMTELLLPLAVKGRLRLTDIESLWFAILQERLDRMLGLTRGGHHFYQGNDMPLSEAWVVALVRCDQDRRSLRLRALAEWKESAKRHLAIPFARSNYSKWSDACDGARWLKILHLLFAAHAKGLLSVDDTFKWKSELTEVSTLIEGLETPFQGATEGALEGLEATLAARGAN